MCLIACGALIQSNDLVKMVRLLPKAGDMPRFAVPAYPGRNDSLWADDKNIAVVPPADQFNDDPRFAIFQPVPIALKSAAAARGNI